MPLTWAAIDLAVSPPLDFQIQLVKLFISKPGDPSGFFAWDRRKSSKLLDDIAFHHRPPSDLGLYS
jgi:hypothetical protein